MRAIPLERFEEGKLHRVPENQIKIDRLYGLRFLVANSHLARELPVFVIGGEPPQYFGRDLDIRVLNKNKRAVKLNLLVLDGFFEAVERFATPDEKSPAWEQEGPGYLSSGPISREIPGHDRAVLTLSQGMTPPVEELTNYKPVKL